ncbi:YciI family protein [Chitinophaga agri]|uniref:DUF6265 domain-containing protein n=1 Tax=Chitinophaga agri TaxID=2703787 RepID=A0A6B9ZA19_9BACT|nr:DUF6265 family protein [Chitinophaga agri]QHS59108.1 hypothetical protein GWR21_05710 [Chitinophaga agri]
MKLLLTYLILFMGEQSFAQSAFPGFLQGTWKVEHKEIYEHWDSLNDGNLKGFSYFLKDGQMTVSEYLDITRKGSNIVYTASVVRQNGGKAVSFKLTQSAGALTFENPAHDFPKKVVYKKMTDQELEVTISDGKAKSETFRMFKQGRGQSAADTANGNPSYDQALAKKLGADEYGMRSYTLVILKTGSSQTTDKQVIQELFRGHMDNINRLVKEGKLIVAGPLGRNDKTYRGIFILKDVGTADEARLLLQTDPAVKGGLLDIELYNWYGSAALPEYLPFSEKIWKVQH